MNHWFHAPHHSFNEKGTYMVTAATYKKERIFTQPEELDLLQNELLILAKHYQWNLEAWALFSNHYHFIAQSDQHPDTMRNFITHFHAASAKVINHSQGKEGRKVWYQYWDSHITFHRSYLARLNYVIQNPVKHQIVEQANQYKWCSASWFENNTSKAYFNTVTSFKTDSVKIFDDF